MDGADPASSTIQSVCKCPVCELVDMCELSLHRGRSCQIQNDALLFRWSIRFGCKIHRPDRKASCVAEVHLSANIRDDIGVRRNLRRVIGTDTASTCWLWHRGHYNPRFRSPGIATSARTGGRDYLSRRAFLILLYSSLVLGIGSQRSCGRLQLMSRRNSPSLLDAHVKWVR